MLPAAAASPGLPGGTGWHPQVYHLQKLRRQQQRQADKSPVVLHVLLPHAHFAAGRTHLCTRERCAVKHPYAYLAVTQGRRQVHPGKLGPASSQNLT